MTADATPRRALPDKRRGGRGLSIAGVVLLVGKRVVDGCHSPTLSHQWPESSYQPASTQNTSTPTAAAARARARSTSWEGSPSKVFM